MENRPFVDGISQPKTAEHESPPSDFSATYDLPKNVSDASSAFDRISTSKFILVADFVLASIQCIHFCVRT